MPDRTEFTVGLLLFEIAPIAVPVVIGLIGLHPKFSLSRRKPLRFVAATLVTSGVQNIVNTIVWFTPLMSVFLESAPATSAGSSRPHGQDALLPGEIAIVVLTVVVSLALLRIIARDTRGISSTVPTPPATPPASS
jgi:hypothetical protein